MESEVDEPYDMLAAGYRKSLEIFVFSNGQQDSPPRKYNVHVNEPWNTTMNFLARSQYGSKLTVELYTIEGMKIEGPLELRDGASYVAVQPPQPFAPAGYQEYLMKASRSREKRQERVTEKESLIKTVKLNIEDTNEEHHKDEHKERIDDLIIVSANAVLSEEQDTITDKVKSDIVKAIRPIRRISALKQPQKRNSGLPQHNSSIIRKNINNVTEPVRKTNNNSRVDVIKKKFETISCNSTKNTIAPAIQSKLKNEKLIGVRLPIHNRGRAESSDLRRETDSGLPDRTFAGFKPKQNLTVDSSTSTTSAIIEQHILRVLPVSVDDGTNNRGSEVIDQNDLLSSAGTFYNRNNDVGIPIKDEGHARTVINSNPQVGVSKAELTTEVLEELSQNETLIFGNQTGNNNFAIYVKKGDTINLKLNIEVKNGSSAVIETNHNHHLKETVSITSTHKSDRGTLANNTAVANNGSEVPGIGESYPGGLPFHQLQKMTNDLKIAMCANNCCPCPRNPERTVPVYVDNNNYIILLPPDTQHEYPVSCTCNLEVNQKSKSDDPDFPVLRKSKSITVAEDKNECIHANDVTVVTEKRKSSTSLSKNLCNDETAVTEKRKSVSSLSKHTCTNSTVISEQRKSVTTLTKNTSRVEMEVNRICDCCETCKVLNLPPACECAQRIVECSVCKNEPTIPTHFVAKQHPLVNNNGNIYKEAFTQTVWTCVVLEARPCGDGNYAFHLPSLEILKLCNVLY